MTAETLRSGGTGCDVEQCRYGIVSAGAQPQHWRPLGCKQLTHGHLKRRKPGVEGTCIWGYHSKDIQLNMHFLYIMVNYGYNGQLIAYARNIHKWKIVFNVKGSGL